jgi:hypothetical protein
MPPPVFIYASDAGHDERSPMRVYGALWAMSTIEGKGCIQLPQTRLQAHCWLNDCQQGDFRCTMPPDIRTGVRCQVRSAKEDIGDPL